MRAAEEEEGSTVLTKNAVREEEGQGLAGVIPIRGLDTHLDNLVVFLLCLLATLHRG